MRYAQVAGRGTRPGLAASETGSVAVETIASLIPLLSIFLLLITLLGGITIEMGLVAASHDAARVAALQPNLQTAREAAEHVVGARGDVVVKLDEDFIAVTVQRGLRIPGIPKTFMLGSTALAYREQLW